MNGHRIRKRRQTLKLDLLPQKETIPRLSETPKIPLWFPSQEKKQNKLVYPTYRRNYYATLATHQLVVTKIQFPSRKDASRPGLPLIYKIMSLAIQFLRLMYWAFLWQSLRKNCHFLGGIAWNRNKKVFYWALHPKSNTNKCSPVELLQS
jgi:hypothetical protein